MAHHARDQLKDLRRDRAIRENLGQLRLFGDEPLPATDVMFGDEPLRRPT